MSEMIDGLPVGMTDSQARVPDLGNRWYVGVNGAETAKGYFVDANGDRALKPDGTLSPSFSGTINAGGGTPKNWAGIAGLTGTVVSNYPDAVGVRVVLSGPVYEDIQASGSASSDFTSNYANYPQILNDPEYNRFGRAL